MNPEPSPPARHYAWPKYVLAALALFLFVTVTWTIREVNKVKRYHREKIVPRASIIPGTNAIPVINAPMTR